MRNFDIEPGNFNEDFNVIQVIKLNEPLTEKIYTFNNKDLDITKQIEDTSQINRINEWVVMDKLFFTKDILYKCVFTKEFHFTNSVLFLNIQNEKI